MSADLAVLLSPWLRQASAGAAGALIAQSLLVNALLSTLLAPVTRRALPRRLHGHPAPTVAALAVFGSLLPLLGPLLLLLMAIVYPSLERAPRRTPQILPPLAFTAEARSRFSRFGAGGAIAQLRNAATGSEQGSRALLAIESRRNQATTQLLTEALSHPDETLRLLAHNLLTRREEDIVTPMSRLEERLDGKATLPGPLALDLAELHLEFLYLGIASGSLRHLHTEAAAQLLDGSGEPPAHAPWHSRWLLAHARLRRERHPADIAGIEACYVQALAAGTAPARALPWLLEKAWRARDYAQVRSLISRHPPFTFLPLIGPAALRWRRSPHA
ncbi:MAG: hypothetical protein M0T84_12075 [Betaproteobacteria bacterium]|nr:hypothetical protein [Betaproteobacteria bacterium]